MVGEPAKKIVAEVPPILPEAVTEKPERELPQAPEVQKLTEDTKEKALKVIQGGKEGAEAAKPTAEIAQTTTETPVAAVQNIQAATAAQTADIVPPPAAEPQAPRKKGLWNWLKNGFRSFWRLFTGAKKE